MTAREFLGQMRTIDKRIEQRLEELARLKSQLTRATALISDMPRGGGHKDWTDTLTHAMELEERLAADVADMIATKSRIREAIDQVDDGRYRLLLEKRYIIGKSWRAIAREMNYDESWVYVIHRRALRQIVVPPEEPRKV